LSKDRSQPLWYLVAFIRTLPGAAAPACVNVKRLAKITRYSLNSILESFNFS